MARPADRRPGFSRRAQYGIFTGYVIAVAGFLAGAGLLVVSIVNPQAFSSVRGAASELARPAGEAGAETRAAGQGVIAAIGAYFQAGRQNAALTREVAAARANALTMQALEGENRRLKALLGIVDPAVKPVTAARLIGSTSASTRRFAVLSAGTLQGVRAGQPVRSAAGLIGRVIETAPGTARVLLVTDPENVVPVRRVRDGLPAFVEGKSDGRIAIRLLNMGVNPLKMGDVFVTSGSGGLYPPGIPVAVVTQVLHDGGTGHLASDPAEVDFVLVLPVFQPAAVAALGASQQAAGPAPEPSEAGGSN
ncbi:rod shape-determining protein MreC [Novosphingobium fuchskuhlense]|uniref:Cell shape-determining protein MreC n=1 Tax=Novosphingobium fuchskuhlense TaxID=1117702 RepID=A0A117UUD6_9SPHN|nr:rod shape-determining protein MreC [Novosphingobium fuchskuhlense]KUR71022.1 rod shape-determining protein MreC [Novosphingobium fuchskuhlense]